MCIVAGGIDAAKGYADRGWQVVILHGHSDGVCTCRKKGNCPSPGKHPRQTAWHRHATSDPLEIEPLFAKWPESNLGIRLGPTSGLIDVEYDDSEGEDTAQQLLTGIITPTYISSRSTHRLYSFPPNFTPPRAVVKVRGLELRFGTETKGAQSVLPPSVHASGVVYTWSDGLSPDDVPLAPFPEVLLSLIESPIDANGHGELVMGNDDTLATSPGTSKGQRNDELCRLIGRHIKTHGVGSEVIQLAVDWGSRCSPPMAQSEVLERVSYIVGKEQTKGIQAGGVTAPMLKLQSRRYSDIEAEPVEWVWEGRIARGKLTLIVGEPGLGKTTLCCDVAARISTGDNFPDGSPTPEDGEVAILTAEDGAEDTLRPRLDAAGANVARVHHIDGVADAAGKEHWFSLVDHLPVIEHWLDEHPKIVVLIIDPISAFLDRIDSHKNSEVRAVLGPVARLAERRCIAIVGITHLTKAEAKAIHRILGSIAFVAAARAAWIVGIDPDDDRRRLFLPIKNNLAQSTGMSFTIESDPANGYGRIDWDPIAVLMSADDIDDRDDTPRAEAKVWLEGLLGNGPVEAREVLKQAERDGISRRTLHRAKKEIGVKSARDGSGWVWHMPDEPDEEVEVLIVE